jgi:outer membrane protein OmpA-like peptidoglycan-associated protein
MLTEATRWARALQATPFQNGFEAKRKFLVIGYAGWNSAEVGEAGKRASLVWQILPQNRCKTPEADGLRKRPRLGFCSWLVYCFSSLRRYYLRQCWWSADRFQKAPQEYATAPPQETPGKLATPPGSQPAPEIANTPAPVGTPSEALESPSPIESLSQLQESPAATTTTSTPPPPSLGATPEPSTSPKPDEAKAGGHLNVPPDSEATPPPVVANRQEEDATRKEVLARIDMMRNLTQKEKDDLYAQVERARGFTKLAIVPFGAGQTNPNSSQTKYLIESLARPEIAKIFDDPTVVLVLAGYADLKGNEAKNLEISRARAENLAKLLQSRTKITNLMRAVGLGGSDIFDKTNPDKNRAVEIWVVRP